MKKYESLNYQIKGMREALDKIEKAAAEDNPQKMRIEINYFKEKSRRITNQIIEANREEGE